MCAACLTPLTNPYGSPTLNVDNSNSLQFKSFIICICLLLIFFFEMLKKIHSCESVAFEHVNVVVIITGAQTNGFSDYKIVHLEKKKKKKVIVESSY